VTLGRRSFLAWLAMSAAARGAADDQPSPVTRLLTER
jgi:hypothetical protein